MGFIDKYKYLNQALLENSQSGKFQEMSFMREIGGIIASDVLLLIARTGVGKSFLALEVLCEALKQGHKVCFFNGEMSSYTLFDRLRKITEKTFEQLASDNNLFLCGNSRETTLNDVQELNALLLEEKFDLVVIDSPYHLVNGMEVSDYLMTIKEIHKYALVSGTPVIATAQANRSTKENEKNADNVKIPNLYNVFNSDSFGHYCTKAVGFSYQKEFQQMHFEVLKNRYGKSGQGGSFYYDYYSNKKIEKKENYKLWTGN